MKFGETLSSTKLILREWYEKNKRDLPWRRNTDPYRVWLSEIILQQTRVSQGLDYYLKFVRTFPDVHSLAEADEQEVLLLWQGLGYYSRARNLHQAARTVAFEMGGRFPDTYEALLKLKGVGSYTAAAIASICFKEPRAVVDGNVSRVIARLYGLDEPVNSGPGSRLVATMAQELLEEDINGYDDPGLHNQAVMEFGALQCIPSSPDCQTCPLSMVCQARLSNRVDSLPVKKPKRKPVDQWMYFFIISDGKNVLLERRGTDDIWKSLCQFPLVKSPSLLEMERIPSLLEKVMVKDLRSESRRLNLEEAEFQIRRISPEIRHQLSHRTLHARFIHVLTSKSIINSFLPQKESSIAEDSQSKQDDQLLVEEARKEGYSADSIPLSPFAIRLDDLGNYPLPRLISRYLESESFQQDAVD
jgi:A/G-specific adenine glycosylase